MKFRQFADSAADRIHAACARGQADKARAPERHLPILDPFTPEGSTAHVDFTTTKTLLLRTRLSPIDHVVADSEWEIAFAETLERMEDVVAAYVKNHALHFEIPYHYAGAERRYRPDYIVRLRDGGAEPLSLVVEIKGLKDNKDAAKADIATALWVPAVNHAGRFGRWGFVEIGQDIYEAERVLRGITAGKREAA